MKITKMQLCGDIAAENFELEALAVLSAATLMPSGMESLALGVLTLAHDRAARRVLGWWPGDPDGLEFAAECEHLTTSEAHAYRKLLIASWCCRNLPNDLFAIQTLADLTVDECAAALTPLRAFFDLTPNGYTHRRTEAEKTAQRGEERGAA